MQVPQSVYSQKGNCMNERNKNSDSELIYLFNGELIELKDSLLSMSKLVQKSLQLSVNPC